MQQCFRISHWYSRNQIFKVGFGESIQCRSQLIWRQAFRWFMYANVRIRQHTSAYVSIRQHTSACVCWCMLTYVDDRLCGNSCQGRQVQQVVTLFFFCRPLRSRFTCNGKGSLCPFWASTVLEHVLIKLWVSPEWCGHYNGGSKIEFSTNFAESELLNTPSPHNFN
jgi:hypothetical protein